MDIQITYGTTINTEDGIWVTNDTDAKTNLANLFNEMHVFSIDELLHSGNTWEVKLLKY